MTALFAKPEQSVIENFKWKDQFGNFHAPQGMKTTHLFHTLRAIWNSSVPLPWRLPGKLYEFGDFYTREYMLTAIKALSKELFTRKDLPADLQAQFDAMVRLLSTHQLTEDSHDHIR